MSEKAAEVKRAEFSEVDLEIVDRLSQEADNRTEQPAASEQSESSEITKRSKLQSSQKGSDGLKWPHRAENYELMLRY